MRNVFAVFVALICGVALAGTPADDCRDCLERNFAAMNSEDIKALMGTIAPSCPRDAAVTFYNEAQSLFRETDVHLSLGDYKFLGIQGPFAAARVVQYTAVAEGGVPTAYRQASNLLPADEAVAYIQIFRRERGKWYIWTSQNEEAIAPPQNRPQPVFTSGCKNGRCRPTMTIRVE